MPSIRQLVLEMKHQRKIMNDNKNRFVLSEGHIAMEGSAIVVSIDNGQTIITLDIGMLDVDDVTKIVDMDKSWGQMVVGSMLLRCSECQDNVVLKVMSNILLDKEKQEDSLQMIVCKQLVRSI